ncbi:hypothetical protein PPSIR1_34582 [Plesiocystis pacifica SIR-1]|uniref:Uncharacterized protein n=1 Tax=Plesiocystis pacifica SIR-1 TaxID=391625 RepID=A6GKB1_9BACT|nr:amphi-Trp domain-containing protein [Plesiocystis pacifica]EDM73690.1 hypothetical protein PPSIR1_34582 [Plesiocystis pacifica SIR-1]
MGDRKQKLSHEAKLTREEVVSLFEDLLAGLRSGAITLNHSKPGSEPGKTDAPGEALTLQPSDTLELELEAKVKGLRESLSVELSWKRPKPKKVERAPTLRIGDAEDEGSDPQPIEAKAPANTSASLLRRRAPEPAPAPKATVEAPAPEASAPAEAPELAPQDLLRLSKERLYALAQALGVPGRSSLPKVALARTLLDHPGLPERLDADDYARIEG